MSNNYKGKGFVVEPVVSSPKDTTEANSMKRKELGFWTIPLTTLGRTSYDRDCFQPRETKLDDSVSHSNMSSSSQARGQFTSG